MQERELPIFDGRALKIWEQSAMTAMDDAQYLEAAKVQRRRYLPG